MNSADIYVLGIDIHCQVEFAIQSYQNYIFFPIKSKSFAAEVSLLQRIKDERNQEISIDQEPSHLPQQAPSYYEEVTGSIERWLIEGDPDKIKNDKRSNAR